MSFEHWWHTYTACPRCEQSTDRRLAASNAWYKQQDQIDRLVEALKKLKALGTDATYNEKGEWINGGFASEGSSIIDEALKAHRK